MFSLSEMALAKVVERMVFLGLGLEEYMGYSEIG